MATEQVAEKRKEAKAALAKLNAFILSNDFYDWYRAKNPKLEKKSNKQLKDLFDERMGEKEKLITSANNETQLDEIIEELNTLNKLISELQKHSATLERKPSPQPPTFNAQENADLRNAAAIWNAVKQASKILWETYTLQDLEFLSKKSKQPHGLFSKPTTELPDFNEDIAVQLNKDCDATIKEALNLAINFIVTPTFDKKNIKEIDLLNRVIGDVNYIKQNKDALPAQLPSLRADQKELMAKVKHDEKWRPLASLLFRVMGFAYIAAAIILPPLAIVGVYCITMSRELSKPDVKTQQIHALSMELDTMLGTLETKMKQDTESELKAKL